MKVKITKTVCITEEVEVNDSYFEKNEQDTFLGYSKWVLSEDKFCNRYGPSKCEKWH